MLLEEVFPHHAVSGERLCVRWVAEDDVGEVVVANKCVSNVRHGNCPFRIT